MPAETTEATDRLTLSAALERALRQSPEVQIALAEVRAAQAGAHQARLLPNPVLSIAFRLPEGGGRTIIEAGLAAELVNILQRPRRISVADAVMRAASAKAVTTTLDVMHETQRYYFDAIALRREMQILTDRNSSISKLLKVAKARHAAGESTQLDVATFEADDVYDQHDAEGFIKLNALRLRLAKMRRK